MAKFLLTAQSNANLRIENNLVISASIIDEIIGGSNRLKQFVYKKQCIVRIKNDDDMCGLRAIVVGMSIIVI